MNFFSFAIKYELSKYKGALPTIFSFIVVIILMLSYPEWGLALRDNTPMPMEILVRLFFSVIVYLLLTLVFVTFYIIGSFAFKEYREIKKAYSEKTYECQD